MPGRKGMRHGVRSHATCHPDRLDMGHGLCKSCYFKSRYYNDGGATKRRMMEYTKAHPEMRKAIWWKHAYGLTPEQCNELYTKQDGRCAICHEPGTLYGLNVDHDHVTGYVRGLLCGLCNRALGQFRDRLDLVVSAKRYMEEWEVRFSKGEGLIGRKRREQSRKPHLRITHK